LKLINHPHQIPRSRTRGALFPLPLLFRGDEFYDVGKDFVTVLRLVGYGTQNPPHCLVSGAATFILGDSERPRGRKRGQFVETNGKLLKRYRTEHTAADKMVSSLHSPCRNEISGTVFFFLSIESFKGQVSFQLSFRVHPCN
jgi:Fe-S oxidoreductase